MTIRFARCLLAAGLLLPLGVWSGERIPQLEAARDSLLNCLDRERDTAQRINLLIDLGDLDLTLGDDYTHVEQLWREALASGDGRRAVGAGKSLTLHWINRGQLDSADVWLARCREHFAGCEGGEGSLAYLEMMREVRNPGDRNKMADDLLACRAAFSAGESPYVQMRTLFMLGILASSEAVNNPTLKARGSLSYMEEGLQIARSLPVEESYSFYLQFLVALGDKSPAYAEEMLSLSTRLASRPGTRPRPWRSRRSDIMAYARLLHHGEELGRRKMDDYFRRFCDLTSRYPYESPTPLDYYFYKEALHYYLYTED